MGENGALCMTIAHLVVQTVRFGLTGVMPLPNGMVPPGFKPTHEDTTKLLSISICFAILIVVIDCFVSPGLGRLKVWFKTISGNCFSFCLLYGISWEILGSIGSGPISSMLLGLAVTMVGFAIIFVLDG